MIFAIFYELKLSCDLETHEKAFEVALALSFIVVTNLNSMNEHFPMITLIQKRDEAH